MPRQKSRMAAPPRREAPMGGERAFWWLAAWLTFIVALVFVLLPLAALTVVGEIAGRRLARFVRRDWWFFDHMGEDDER